MLLFVSPALAHTATVPHAHDLASLVVLAALLGGGAMYLWLFAGPERRSATP